MPSAPSPRRKFILLYDFDDREGETDFAIRSDAVTPKDIVRMRKDGGGLICTAVHPVAAQRLGLPFASDALRAHRGCRTGRRYSLRPGEPFVVFTLGEPPEHLYRGSQTATVR